MKNKYSYEFDRVDLRRMWLVIGAISLLERPTASSIARSLSFQKSTVQKILSNIERGQLLTFELNIEGVVLSIKEWGVLDQNIIEDYYNNYCKVRP